MNDEELFEQYRATHDVALRNAIVEKYLYIAEVIAKKFSGRGVEYDDLFQAASLALMRGVDRFDPSRGVRFSTFITPTIAGEIKNYFRDHARSVHLPRAVSELRANIRETNDRLTVELGRTPTTREIATALGVSEEEVVSGAEAGTVVSLDRPAAEGETTFHELIASADDGGIEQLENRDLLLSVLEKLGEAERILVKYRFVECLSQAETAKRMNVSQMRVSRLERKTLEKLRALLNKEMAE